MQTKLDPKQTCIIIDFDKTITLGKVNGVSVPSIISILRSENYLSAEYTAAAYELEAKYKPIEADHNLPFETRYIAMENWWNDHLNLLIKLELNLNHIKQASESKQIVIRDGFAQLIDFTFENNIPMIIFSASGIGFEPIELVLKRENLLRENIVIISNRFVWDENGVAVSRVTPTIHSFAKTGTMLKTTESWPRIADKKFAVVVGDALHDLRMSEGIDFDQVISFGVLNEVTPESLELYKKSFTHVIRDGESLEQVLKVFV